MDLFYEFQKCSNFRMRLNPQLVFSAEFVVLLISDWMSCELQRLRLKAFGHLYLDKSRNLEKGLKIRSVFKKIILHEI